MTSESAQRPAPGDFNPTSKKHVGSTGDLEVGRGQARITLEVADWLLKRRGWPDDAERLAKVYFASEPDIPFPEKKSLKDFPP